MKDSMYIKNAEFSVAYSYEENIPDAINNNHCHDKFEILYVIRGVGK